MSQTITLSSQYNRSRAKRLVEVAPAGAVMVIRPASRTTDQNALLWSMLSEISRAKPEGRSLPPETWKCLFMNAAGFQCTFEPGLDGEGVVPPGFKSSRLSKAEFSDLIEVSHEYAARHGIVLGDGVSTPRAGGTSLTSAADRS